MTTHLFPVQYNSSKNALREHGRRLCALVYRAMYGGDTDARISKVQTKNHLAFLEDVRIIPYPVNVTVHLTDKLTASFTFLAKDVPLPPGELLNIVYCNLNCVQQLDNVSFKILMSPI